jgi:hypothetical protein
METFWLLGNAAVEEHVPSTNDTAQATASADMQ